MSSPREILEFWFGKPGEARFGRDNPLWWQPTPEHIDLVRERFGSCYQEAVAGGLGEWEATPEGALALILLLDQFSNLIDRGSAGAFALDARGREVARRAIARGDDRHFPDAHRWFFYLPLEHSEDLADQDLSVELFSALEANEANRNAVDFALRHRRVIQRFGRFPNRNEALGRESSPEELEFLAGPDAPY